MKKHLFLSLSLIGATAFAQNSATPAETAANAQSSPASACKTLAESAKAKDYQAVMNLTDGLPAPGKVKGKQKQGFDKMHTQYLDKLQDLNCGQEMIAQDRAVVQADSQGQKRLVPFVRTNEGWKFDIRTYRSFYDTGMAHGKANKKM